MLALDVARVEAGLLLIDVDFHSSKKALIEAQKYSPFEMGLGRLVQLDKRPFVGRDALRDEPRRGPRARRSSASRSSWPAVESALRASSVCRRRSPPRLARRRAGLQRRPPGRPGDDDDLVAGAEEADRAGDDRRRRTSPMGTALEIEITVEAVRHRVPATVVKTPFFNPARKTSVPLEKVSMSEPLDRAAKQQLVDEIGTWHHSIDLGDGVVTPGGKTPHHFYDELRRLRLPEMADKSVLDIGAWDGFYTFHAEHARASRVVALDHYAWSIDFEKATAYRARERASGLESRAFDTVPEVWDPIGLPGKRGFDLAHRVRNSRAEVVVDDIMTMDLTRLGTFDVVLFLGVIYHLEQPLQALRRVRQRPAVWR